MPNFRPRFKDDADFSSGEAEGRRRAGGPPRPSAPLERDPFRITRAYPVRNTNETAVIDRRSDYDLRTAGQKPSLDVRRTNPVVSAQPKKYLKSATKALTLAADNRKKKLQSSQAVGADRRLFNFTGFPKNTNGTFARVVATPGAQVRFKLPSRVIPCIQRHVRKEVLFAKRKAGGAGSRSAKRRTATSNIGC